MAQCDEFAKVLHTEIQAHQLCAKDVMACIDHLYETVSKCTKGNDIRYSDCIIIRGAEFSFDEFVALFAFLKVQDNWPNPLMWEEG